MRHTNWLCHLRLYFIGVNAFTIHLYALAWANRHLEYFIIAAKSFSSNKKHIRNSEAEFRNSVFYSRPSKTIISNSNNAWAQRGEGSTSRWGVYICECLPSVPEAHQDYLFKWLCRDGGVSAGSGHSIEQYTQVQASLHKTNDRYIYMAAMLLGIRWDLQSAITGSYPWAHGLHDDDQQGKQGIFGARMEELLHAVMQAHALKEGPTQPRPPVRSFRDVCRKWNRKECNYPYCRYTHVCSSCEGAHLGIWCPNTAAGSQW